NDISKLIMHRLITRSLARDPTLLERAKDSLFKSAIKFPGRLFVVEWQDLLRLPMPQLRARLLSRDQHMKRLRLSSPFVTAAGVDFTTLRKWLNISPNTWPLYRRCRRKYRETSFWLAGASRDKTRRRRGTNCDCCCAIS